MRTLYLHRQSGRVDTLNLWDEPLNAYLVDGPGLNLVWLRPKEAETLRPGLKKNPGDGSLKLYTCWSPYLDPMWEDPETRKHRVGVPYEAFTVEWVGVGEFKDMDHVRWHVRRYTYDPIIKEVELRT